MPGALRHLKAATTAGGSSRRPSLAAASGRNDNPDLDEIMLDDDYYQEIGMTREQAMRQQQEVRSLGLRPRLCITWLWKSVVCQGLRAWAGRRGHPGKLPQRL